MPKDLDVRVQCYRNGALLNAVPIELKYPISLAVDVRVVPDAEIIKDAKTSLHALHVPGWPYDNVRFEIQRR